MTAKLQTPRLPKLTPGMLSLEDEEIVHGLHFSGEDHSNTSCSNLILNGCRLEKVVMQRTELRSFECVDVVFEKCDFSNLEWIRGSFHRVVFDQCKLTGINFSESFLRDCRFNDCVINFGSFSATDLKKVHFEQCQLEESDFFEITWKNLSLSKNNLNNSNWMRTTLKNLDFRGNEFNKILFSQEKLNGLIVDLPQALVISSSLGLIIN